MTFKHIMGVFILTLGAVAAQAQTLKDGKLYLNADGSHYLKGTMLVQTWLRYQDYNPGTTIFGYNKNGGADIGIRRFRAQILGQLTDRVFIYAQVGENNFNNLSDRKFGLFLHDALGEYAVIPKHLYVGGGLTAWSGLSRFASPAVGSIMGLDAPLFEQSTNDVTDQFLRKLGVYAKGKVGKLDYRISMAQPMAIQKSAAYNPAPTTSSNFSPLPPKWQTNAYFQYQFMDQEANTLPYTTGTYLGKKKVFNLGAGLVYQPQAMWHLDTKSQDTVQTDMLQLAADVFYDAPLGQKGQALHLYGCYTYFDFGPNYIRNLGVMNPANGNSNPNMFNGGGNAFPMIGTGSVLYGQAGYKFKDDFVGKTTLMPYGSVQAGLYPRLNSPMVFVDAGVNWLLNGHGSKLTLAYQNRPVYQADGKLLERKGAVVAQYQVFFN